MNRSQGLSRQAYEPVPKGQTYQPYVNASEQLAEFTWKTLILGILFGIVFGAANAYLGLRAGLTISTSIPVAVMTVAVFRVLRALGRKDTILEANLSQTVGSASSSLASGVIFTLPALFLWELDPSLIQMTLLALCGGLVGVLFMIPLRRFLIAREHGFLPYPEGTACAQVLVASEAGGTGAARVFKGLAVGAVFKLLVGGLKIVPESVEVPVPFLKKGQLGSDISTALFGVGYILGPKVSAIMVGGGLLSWLILIPAIAIWGEGRSTPLYPEAATLIRDMSPDLIWTRYVRYIGAGAVAAGGFITLIKSLPTMLESFRIGARQLRERLGQTAAEQERTDQDLPLSYVAGGLALIAAAMAVVPYIFASIDSLLIRTVAAALVLFFAFFFVTVSSRIVGLVGVTSNPTSGMTIATLLGASSIFLLAGWTGDLGKAAAITVGCVVAIAASIAGDTSQDLKTGFLLGATPRRQQIGELIGVLTSALFVCASVLLLDQAYGFGTGELPAPQATLMKLVIEGVLESSLPWTLVGLGVIIALLVEVLGVNSLAFAVGVYLPITTTFPVFLGGGLRFLLERGAATAEEKEQRRERGVLLGSGFVGGEGLLGVGIAGAAFYLERSPEGIGHEWAGAAAEPLAVAAFALLIWSFARSCRARS